MQYPEPDCVGCCILWFPCYLLCSQQTKGEHMRDLDYEIQEEILNQLENLISTGREAALDAGINDVVIDMMSNLTPARRGYIHAHFFEMFEFAPGVYEEMKQRLRPS